MNRHTYLKTIYSDDSELGPLKSAGTHKRLPQLFGGLILPAPAFLELKLL